MDKLELFFRKSDRSGYERKRNENNDHWTKSPVVNELIKYKTSVLRWLQYWGNSSRRLVHLNKFCRMSFCQRTMIHIHTIWSWTRDTPILWQITLSRINFIQTQEWKGGLPKMSMGWRSNHFRSMNPKYLSTFRAMKRAIVSSFSMRPISDIYQGVQNRCWYVKSGHELHGRSEIRGLGVTAGIICYFQIMTGKRFAHAIRIILN